MNNLKNIKVWLIIMSFLLVYGLYKLNDYLSIEKKWIYATGTNEVVFGDITWGMSKQEVERVIGEKLSNQEFKSNKFTQVVENEVSLPDIKNGHFIFENFDDYKNFKINFEIKYSKPLKDFFGIESGNVVYKFYKNKLFCVVLFSSIESEKYKNYDTEFQYSIEDSFHNKKKDFESRLTKSLELKYGKLDLRKLRNNKFIQEQEDFLFTNLNYSNTLIDGRMGYVGFENFLVADCWIKFRYIPIIEEINRDIKESETTFFK